MGKRLQAVRGMSDGLPEQLTDWQQLEAILRQLVAVYGYREIRTPLLEQAALFMRTIGEATDVVEKEMYLLNDRRGELLALRPEGTAGCVRAGIEQGLLYHQAQRLWYLGPMFRYERPQKGRYRQFHQFGVEAFGLIGPDIEVELILMTVRLWQTLGISDQLQLQVNSIGSAAEREAYRQALVDYLKQNYSQLDADSQRRLQSNPLRILDSKQPQVQALLINAPRLSDYLEESSKQHFVDFCQLLTQLQIPYQINERLVRGLDYYNRTVFEWVTEALGAQNGICGGGRYDGMVEQLGGKATPAAGFSIGMERLLLLWQQAHCLRELSTADCYMVAAGHGAIGAALALAEQIRSALPRVRVMTHCGGGAFTKQFKQADKVGAQVAIVLGERELAQQQVVIKRLQQKTEAAVEEQWLVPQSQVVEQLQQLFNE